MLFEKILTKNKLIRNFCDLRFFLLLTLLFSACQKKNQINAVFEEKYGKEIEQIKLDRAPPKVDKNSKNIRYDFEPPIADAANDNYNPKNLEPQPYYANVDPEEYSKVPPRQFFPDGKVYAEGKATQTLPENMFDLSYNTNLSPPFKSVKSEFDLVKIPPYDSYGVRTALEEKEYVLIGNNYLQRNIDKINSSKSKEDIEMSKILIKEQRELRKKYMMGKIFGKSDQNTKKISDESEQKNELKKENSDENNKQKTNVQ